MNKELSVEQKSMISKDWFDEVSKLNQMKRKIIGLDSIGYREIGLFLEGKVDKDLLEEKIIVATRQFAKKQVQWFSKEKLDLKILMDQLILMILLRYYIVL